MAPLASVRRSCISYDSIKRSMEFVVDNSSHEPSDMSTLDKVSRTLPAHLRALPLAAPLHLEAPRRRTTSTRPTRIWKGGPQYKYLAPPVCMEPIQWQRRGGALHPPSRQAQRGAAAEQQRLARLPGGMAGSNRRPRSGVRFLLLHWTYALAANRSAVTGHPPSTPAAAALSLCGSCSHRRAWWRPPSPAAVDGGGGW